MEPGRDWDKFGNIWPDFGNIWGELKQHRAGARPASTESGLRSSEFGGL